MSSYDDPEPWEFDYDDICWDGYEENERWKNPRTHLGFVTHIVTDMLIDTTRKVWYDYETRYISAPYVESKVKMMQKMMISNRR